MSRSPALADLVLAVHALVGVAVFGGLVVAIAGQILRWRWTQSYGWRVPHLAVTVYLFLRARWEIPCPFSTWEDSLRPATADGLQPATSTEGALRFLAFRNLSAPSFSRAMTVFALVTILLFLLQQITARRKVRQVARGG